MNTPHKKPPAAFLYVTIMPILLAILYLIGTANMDYGYYTFIRIATLILLGIFLFAYMSYTDSFINFPNVTAIIIMILFNPITPIYLSKSVWIVFDIISAIVLVIDSLYILIAKRNVD